LELEAHLRHQAQLEASQAGLGAPATDAKSHQLL
jgi:hypothetical protein